LALAEAEAMAYEAGEDVRVHVEISPSIMIMSGLELEDLQYVCEDSVSFLWLIHYVTLGVAFVPISQH
jgi:hypothetical protein